jgi:uncharacterized membrane protein
MNFMMNPIKYYFIVFFLLIVIDMIMIQFVFKKLYQNVLRKINPTKSFSFRILPILFFYLITALGFYLFVLPNIRSNHLVKDSLFYGGIFGFVLYGFYSTTIFALIEKWTSSLVFIDIIWGAVLGFIVVYATSFIKYRL